MHSIFSDENLQTFVTVAKQTSFSKAAEELGLTVAAVSYSIKRLETYLGVPLFIRSTRNISLTETGFYFYHKAEELLDEFRTIERSVSSLEKGVEAKITICINNLLHSSRHTSTLVAQLKKRFPSCKVNVITEVYNGVWEALMTKHVDIALGAPGIVIDGGGIDFFEIGHIKWEFIVPLNHPLALLPEPISESILRHYPAISIEDTANNSIAKKTAWLLHGQEAINVPDLQTKHQLQLLGVGIGFLPDYYVKDDIKNKLMVKKKIQNMRQPSRMLLAINHSMKGQVTQWIKKEFMKDGILSLLYQDILHQNEVIA